MADTGKTPGGARLAQKIATGGPDANIATLVISSRNYSSWSLRGWLLLRMSGLRFREVRVGNEDAVARAELLNKTSSTRIPTIEYKGVTVWDTMAIAEFLNELCPAAQMYPTDFATRARCRAVSGEMHAGFAALRSALPVNLHAFRPNFPIWSGVRSDIIRVTEIFRESLTDFGGPFLFGARMSVADAMFAPVCTRFATYDVDLDPVSEAYKDRILALPDMVEWTTEAKKEPELVSELEVEGEF
jgi:glutathione S-transferase